MGDSIWGVPSSINAISQQIQCSDSLLISYSSYMFPQMYIIIKQPSLVCPAGDVSKQINKHSVTIRQSH
jgi:hypothetical protein